MQRFFCVFALLFLGLASILQLYWLKRQDFSLSHVSAFPVEGMATEEMPSPDFLLGDLHWNVSVYSRSAKLSDFRQYFQEHCGDRTGIRAASCLADSIGARVPFGGPKSSEMYGNSFDPEEAFAAHLAGAQGNCGCYSNMVANALLSVGNPARIVQIYSPVKGDHNIVEVWDKENGWVAFDPLSDSVFTATDTDRMLSVQEAMLADDNFVRIEACPKAPSQALLKEYYDDGNPFREATVVFPGPWTYTRVGEKQTGIFRSAFVAFGPNSGYSWKRNLAVAGVLICWFGMLVMVYILFRTFRRKLSIQ
jgi:hypothetical protein